MSNEYIALLIITTSIWILLWLGYRKNKINDENKKREKQARINEKIERRKKLESLYPGKNKWLKSLNIINLISLFIVFILFLIPE